MLFRSDKKEIPAALFQGHPLSGIDLMGVYDNVALGRLAEDFCEHHHRKFSRLDHIPQDISRPHAGKLVHIPHQDQPGPHVDSL